MVVVSEAKAFPTEDAPVGTRTRARRGSQDCYPRVAELFRQRVDVPRVRGPIDEARGGYPFEHRHLMDRRWLNGVCLGIRCHDFKIAALAERKKSISRATTRVDPTHHSANPRVFFDESDATIKVLAAEDDVIEQ